MKKMFFAAALMMVMMSCEIVDNDPEKHVDNKKDSTFVGLEEVAEIMARLPISPSQLNEVHDAVTSSSGNGYDEEYTMKHLFEAPGSGVGDEETKAVTLYEKPLRELIEEHVRSNFDTRSGGGEGFADPDAFLDALTESDIQIYWPFSEEWDGSKLPIVTFDPEDGSEVNIGYRLIVGDDGFRHVEEVEVDEAMALEEPVWVVNRNSDAGFTSLEMLRRNDPEWGEGGGNIIVRPSDATKSGGGSKCLILKDFTMKRNYDSWFAGASEFFVKIGYMPDFTAATEAELKLYNPLVTDFMIVVKRSQVGKPQNFNAILMSDWYEHDKVEDACAFMIIEDDGGTKDSWSAKAKVYVSGKSYGVEMTLPLNSRDDIVWRGMLSRNWLDRCNGTPWTFGDINLTFELREY